MLREDEHHIRCQNEDAEREDEKAPRKRRSGAVAIETAVVSLVLFVLLFAIIVGGMGVFRYELVALQAREAARWASVRGSDWTTETGKASPDQEEIFQKAVLPYATTMDPDRIVLKAYWIDGTTGNAQEWDKSPKHPISLDKDGRPVANRVRVTITYEWSPLFFQTNTKWLRSTSEMPMTF